MKEEDIEKITEYVYKNYRWLKNKKLIIREKENCFHIVVNKDASPLILGKSIINQ